MGVKCNFKTFNGLCYKCDLKHTSLESDEEYKTCDEDRCVLMKILNVFRDA